MCLGIPGQVVEMYGGEGLPMGIVDFDVLDGVDEFLGACDAVGLRGSTGMETRVFVPEFADREINSPGEPGVTEQAHTVPELTPGASHVLEYALDTRLRPGA